MDSLTRTGAIRFRIGQVVTDPGTLACLLGVAVCLTGWVWAVTGSPPPARAVLLFLAWPYVALRAGRALTATLGLTAAFVLPFLLGNAALATALMLVKVLFPVPTPVVVWAGLGIAWFLPRLLPDRRPERAPARTSGGEAFAVFLCLAAATAWNQHEFPPTVPSGETITFRPWSDHFTHATFVTRLLQPQSVLEFGNYECKGQPALVYHYGSYLFPAAFASACRCTAFESLCAFWVPLGLVLLGLAGYALGREFWGHGAGLAALAAVLLLPDTSVLPVANPMLSYFNILVVGPASLYGIAIAATGLILVVDAARRGDRPGLLGGLAVAATVVCFKTHVFIASFPLTVGFAILACRGVTQTARCLVLAGTIVAAVLAVTLANHYHLGPAMRPDLSGGVFYFRVLADQMPQTSYGSLYAVFRQENGFPTHLLRAALLISLTTFGVYVLLGPLALLAAVRRRDRQPTDFLALGAAGIYLAMALGLPENRGAFGSPEELQHRPFVWAYFLVGALTAARLVSLFGTRLPNKARWTGSVLCACLLAVPVVLGNEVHHQKTSWGPAGVDVKLPRGFVACARFIRRHRPASALVQDSDLGEHSHIIGALCQRRCFLARPDGWERGGQRFRSLIAVEARSQLKRLQQAATCAEFRAAVAATGIRWYLLRPEGRVGWPASICARMAFEADGYRVYDLQACLAAPTEPSSQARQP